MLTSDLNNSASLFMPIDLVSADSAKLMKRFDVKYVVPAYRIPDVLDGLSASYRLTDRQEDTGITIHSTLRSHSE